jgi:hypothetical protein
MYFPLYKQVVLSEETVFKKPLNIFFQFHSSKEITAFDCFLAATVKIQQGNFKKLLNSL